MNKLNKQPGKMLPVIIGHETFFPVGLISSILQIPMDIAKFIVDSNLEIALDENPDAPEDCLLERVFIALQDSSHRLALDMASMLLPFEPDMAMQLASELPWGGEFILDKEVALIYQTERIKSGIPSLLRSLNPNIPSPITPDKLLLPKQAGEILGLRPTRVSQLARDLELNYQKTACGQYRFRFEDVRDYKIKQDLLASDTLEQVDNV